jgi:WD40 repeat protein
MSPEQGCAVGLAVAAALHHAHTRGVLHRDVKADNILFAADGTPKVGDFGISKLFEGATATASRQAGTPQYMAPEQITRGRIGPATDLYALGVVLYQLLTGKAPFDPGQPVQTLWHQHLNDAPPPMGGVPTPVAEVVLRALSKNAADRQADAHTFAIELAVAATRAYGPGWTGRAGLPLHLAEDVRRAAETPPPPPAVRTPKRFPLVPPAVARSRRRLLTVAGAGATAAILAVVVLLTTFSSDPPGTGSAASPSPTPAATSGAAPSPTVTTVDWSNPTPLGAPLQGTSGVFAQAFSPNGRILATGFLSDSDGGVQLWNVADPAHPAALGDPLTGSGMVLSVAFSPNGRILATGSLDADSNGRVQLWAVADPAHPAVLGAPRTGPGGVASVAFSPNGHTLAAGCLDSTLRLLNVTDPAHPAALGAPQTDSGAVSSVAFSPDGHTLAAGSYDGGVWLWDMADPAHPTALRDPLGDRTSRVASVAFSPNGHTLAAASDNGTIWLRNVADPAHPAALGAPLIGSSGVSSVVFSPDGRTLAAASGSGAGGGSDGRVRLWKVTEPAQPVALRDPLANHPATMTSVVFSPAGRTLAAASTDGMADLWTAG